MAQILNKRFNGVLGPKTGYTSGYYLDVRKQKAIFVETVFIIFFCVCHQDKRPGVLTEVLLCTST